MIKILAIGGALALSIAVSGCSSMMGDTASASTVSPDSAGKGAVSGASSMSGSPATVGNSGNKN